jgi:acetyltransferase-like isoleucine patch superfamily enzyme
MKIVLYAIGLLLPWVIRRWLLVTFFKYTIHPTGRIGFAWVMPGRLVMEADSKIGALTVCRGLDLLQMKEHAEIGRGNWIVGCPAGDKRYFGHQHNRKSELLMGQHSAITSRHLIECMDSVTIGDFSVFAGYRSQILTHSVDLENSRQSSAPVKIGDYCFTGTNCVLLGGSVLPSYSVLGAKSLLNKQFSDTYWLYAGVPARPVTQLDSEMKYFKRKVGVVD